VVQPVLHALDGSGLIRIGRLGPALAAPSVDRTQDLPEPRFGDVVELLRLTLKAGGFDLRR
jgi:hypothetical protein